MTPRMRLGSFAFLTLALFLMSCGRQPSPMQPYSSVDSKSAVSLASGSGSSGTFTLQVQKSGTGSGTVTSNPSGISCGTTCSKSFSGGTSVTLSATPASGSVFAGWSGGGCSGTGTCTVNLTANTTVTATFNPSTTTPPPTETFTLTVTKIQNGTSSGTVTSSPAGIDCGTTCTATFPAGTLITLTATPSSGVFTGWSGTCSGSTNPSCSFTLNQNMSVTASFDNQTQSMLFLDSTLPDGNVGADYSAFINTNGGSGGQDEFSIVSGSLPDGLKMEKFFGVQSTVIHGKPSRTQTSTFTVRAQDESSSATRTFSITINGAVPLAITLPGPTAKSGTVGTAYFQNLFANGGETPYSWSITGGALPPGLRLVAASNGNRIEGTPTTRGTFTFTLTVRDKGGQQASQVTSITID